jgi:hypothetical protein
MTLLIEQRRWYTNTPGSLRVAAAQGIGEAVGEPYS